MNRLNRRSISEALAAAERASAPALPPITLTIGGVVDDFLDLRDADFPASEMIRDEEPGWLLRSLKQGA